MGKVLIIRGADFSENALGKVSVNGVAPYWVSKQLLLCRVTNYFNHEIRYLTPRTNRGVVVCNTEDTSQVYHFSQTPADSPIYENQNNYSYLNVPSWASKVKINMSNTNYEFFVELNSQTQKNIISVDSWGNSCELNIDNPNLPTLFMSITIRKPNNEDLDANLNIQALGLSISFE